MGADSWSILQDLPVLDLHFVDLILQLSLGARRCSWSSSLEKFPTADSQSYSDSDFTAVTVPLLYLSSQSF